MKHIWGWRIDGYCTDFSKESVQDCYETGIPALPELYPKDNQAHVRIAFAHVGDELTLLRGMLVGVVMGAM